MKAQIIAYAITGLLCTYSFAQAQYTWSFDSKEILLSDDQSVVLDFYNVRNSTEVVEGLKGKGLRTDGYSTWLSGTIKKTSLPFSLSGWFALESFPTDTAAFFAVKDSKANQSLSLCVDRFGEILLGSGNDEEFSYTAVGRSVERFKWLHLAVSADKNGISIFVNGEKASKMFPVGSLSQVDKILIAKDVKERMLHIHDLSTINGIIDEIKVWSGVLNTKALRKEISPYTNREPVLAVPDSRFKNDFSRPKYHLLPAANWTNETHGLIYYNNRYHIFNQKNASGLLLRQINWGHFSSPDLINWIEHKPAITPEKGYDENGIWSGHVVMNDEGIPTIIYTSGGARLGIGIAFPKDANLVEWQKYEHNPVVPGQPERYSRTDLRDPYVWKEGDKWYMAVGFGIVEEGIEKGSLLLYTSPDLKKWDFVHTLFDGDPAMDDSGVFWEMPVFEKIGQKYVLLVNKVPHKGIPARAMYWVGDFKNEKFVPDDPAPRNLEVINRLLSPSVAYDKDGKLIAIAIIPDEIRAKAAYTHGWTHLYSIPRVWDLKNGKITQAPHPALQGLREAYRNIAATSIKAGRPLLISENQHQVEIKARIQPNNSKKYGFTVQKSADNSEYTSIYYDAAERQIVVDQSKSSIKEHIPLDVRTGNYDIDPSKPVDFHLFMDGSVVEVFINGEDAFTTRIFPLKAGSNQVEIFCDEGEIEASVEVWTLRQANMLTDF